MTAPRGRRPAGSIVQPPQRIPSPRPDTSPQRRKQELYFCQPNAGLGTCPYTRYIVNRERPVRRALHLWFLRHLTEPRPRPPSRRGGQVSRERRFGLPTDLQDRQLALVPLVSRSGGGNQTGNYDHDIHGLCVQSVDAPFHGEILLFVLFTEVAKYPGDRERTPLRFASAHRLGTGHPRHHPLSIGHGRGVTPLGRFYELHLHRPAWPR